MNLLCLASTQPCPLSLNLQSLPLWFYQDQTSNHQKILHLFRCYHSIPMKRALEKLICIVINGCYLATCLGVKIKISVFPAIQWVCRFKVTAEIIPISVLYTVQQQKDRLRLVGYCLIKPGKPYQNAFTGRLNRTYQQDVLDLYLFIWMRCANSLMRLNCLG